MKPAPHAPANSTAPASQRRRSAATVCKMVRPTLWDRCLAVCPVCSVCNVGVLWPNGWTDQGETWHGGRPPPWPHCVRWGPNIQLPQKGTAPNFSAHVYCGLTTGWIKMPLSMEVGLGSGDIVLDGDPAPPRPKRDTVLHFSAHVYCGQMARWIKMQLGTELGLGLGVVCLSVCLSVTSVSPAIAGEPTVILTRVAPRNAV